MKKQNDIEEQVFKIVQKFLKNPPLIVWGSGATVSFGLPSMWSLNESLKKEITDFDTSNDNLEEELSKDKYREKLPQIKKTIWNEVNKADVSVLKKITSNETDTFNGIKLLIEKFIETHPKILNIVTTNYDRVLEHLLAYENICFTDGFEGKTLSAFDETNFQNKNIVNIVKVHGSLNWFNVNGEIRYLSNQITTEAPQIVVPSKNKFEETYNTPYRELIQKSDILINDTLSFLVIGFGFNDKHLTPKIQANIKKGVPLVLITKEITSNTFKELENAKKYILFEEAEIGKTRVIYKESNSTEKIEKIIQGDFWQLNKFMEIL
ncbi:SIR2-like protein [Tenacibaculum lutimaris]|uniref:SIR2-like protein n=1 Tax=Tenacibaculum lutimaris TaxID=285258 RepID=A0A420E1E0_9FLAO|nr:SIR2 family protein [Tenacibaculum lutimaris]RKF03713.1 SIR2-like protein [Tenacibaculum lutimaris]